MLKKDHDISLVLKHEKKIDGTLTKLHNLELSILKEMNDLKVSIIKIEEELVSLSKFGKDKQEKQQLIEKIEKDRLKERFAWITVILTVISFFVGLYLRGFIII